MARDWRERSEIFTSSSYSMSWSRLRFCTLGNGDNYNRKLPKPWHWRRKTQIDRLGRCARLTLAWLHVEAMDFQGARELCEEVDDTILEENPFAFFFHRAVLAKAFVGLNDPQRALKQFEDVQRRVDADGTGLDFTIYTQFYHCFGEYCLLVGDIAQARTRAAQLRDYAAPAPDRNHLALAYGLLARIALAAGDLDDARAQLSRALATLDNANLPLAAWRIYLTAAEICESLGEASKASEYRRAFRERDTDSRAKFRC